MTSSAAARAAPAPAPEGEGLGDDDILLGSPVATPPEAPPVEEQGRRRHRLRVPPARSGTFSVYIIGDARLPDPVGAADLGRLPGSADQQVIGIVDVVWKLVGYCQEARVAYQWLLPSFAYCTWPSFKGERPLGVRGAPRRGGLAFE